jgi:hypothetical protein
MRRLALALGSLALASLASSPALADCPPGSALCASVGVGLPPIDVGGQISVGIPQIVVPVPVAPAAPPPVYVYAEPPPPPAYYPAPRRFYVPPTYYGVGKVGLDLHVDGAMGFGASNGGGVYGGGGAGLALRYHALPHFGLEVGTDFLGGHDWEGRKTTTVSGNAGGLIYLNPRSRAQVYLSGGMLVDHTSASTQGAYTLMSNVVQADSLAYTHLGGYAGMGLELFATRRLAFHLDARGIVRQNVSGNAPEFTDPSTGRTTNTSGGLVTQAGLVFYF